MTESSDPAIQAPTEDWTEPLAARLITEGGGPLESVQEMPEDTMQIPGTQYDKVPKLLARYVEFSAFKNADKRKGYFCASCVYFFEGKDECAIVQSKGESADGEDSDHVAPFGMCALWKNASVMEG